MKTTEKADEYLRSEALRKHLVECLSRVDYDIPTFSRISRAAGGWFLEIDRYRAWFRVQVGWIHDDTADFMVEATAYYHKAPINQFVVTDLGDGLRELRVETGAIYVQETLAVERFIHRHVNQGTSTDLPLVDFIDGMVITRLNVGVEMLPAAILGSKRLAKFRASK